ncbi:DNA helicase [Paramuricea clavata]|uniref:DNA 3'-5' helicase n=1 Tax=Paramuricea clavata TaxID=317549 RepID=A0A7D9DKH5_PARCT|nr:DNA helicase [Paramuricea clavata]
MPDQVLREKLRLAYGKLGILANIFPHTPIVAMTATATYDTQCKIIESLGMNRPQIVKTNPDRPNIYFSCKKRGNSGEEKLSPILDNLVAELDPPGLNTPFTLVYGTLEVVSECLLYVSMAFGIGVDLKDIRRVIHIGVPYSMEEYFQEIGRGGRDGLPSTATLYYNSHDLSKRRKEMSNVMRNYVTSTSVCRREMILKYFGYILDGCTLLPNVVITTKIYAIVKIVL